MTTHTAFVLNGEPVATQVRPDTTVLDLLRDHLGRKGTKEGCAEGDCGACTILFRRGGDAETPMLAANSCIMSVAQIDGGEIVTVEGLAGDGAVLNAVQDEMAKNGSSQCGFCTPGIAVALTGLLACNPDPDEDAIHDALAGNLCRCTGYRPIVDAARAAAARMRAEPAPAPATGENLVTSHTDAGGATAHRPRDLRGLLMLRRDHPDAVLLAGGTDLGVPLAGYETTWPETITTGHVAELRRVETGDGRWTFGAAVTWEEVLKAVAEDYPSFATLIRRFGSTQIRSMGTIGGNIGTASPIGDGPPALIALGATITLVSLEGGERTMRLEDFFLDYRKTELRPDEVIASVTVPRARAGEILRTYKISKRYDQDISTVCGAYWLAMDGGTVSDIRIAYGGMAATPKRASHAEAALRGKALTVATAREAGAALASDFKPLTDWRGSATYRERTAAGLLERLARDVAGETVEVMAL
ncbi:MAG: xanthine dehydrogenase small subunit [Roseitalea sp.]|jgi:xanthine dehydrogenase small subunit|nr:xanthine dehydrogenase small subunit [Roseitalea sp.]MBO6721405.1 xanthine dehydrogenase small subunit [Roseitalea sp.]MBO6744590.1 xanthine dehydrogenase small subunit [Roseitalea sp.]